MNPLAGLSHGALVREIERNVWELWGNWGKGPGCVLHQDTDTLWFDTPLPLLPYNGVIKFQVTQNCITKIDAIIDHYQSRHVPFVWMLHPTSAPANLYDLLLKKGLMDVEPIYGMARALVDIPQISGLPSDIEIRKTTTESDFMAFYQFVAWRWKVPKELKDIHTSLLRSLNLEKESSNIRIWQAWRNEHPLAKLILHLGTGSAGIYAVITKDEARGCGVAKALILTALHSARLAGYSLAVLHSTPMAQAMYTKLGFQTFGEFHLFASGNIYF